MPVCFALDGDAIVSAVDHKPKTTAALARLADINASGAPPCSSTTTTTPTGRCCGGFACHRPGIRKIRPRIPARRPHSVS